MVETQACSEGSILVSTLWPPSTQRFVMEGDKSFLGAAGRKEALIHLLLCDPTDLA